MELVQQAHNPLEARGELRNGEEVVGLAWAMMVAGVPSVVVSQWKVDSASTTELMVAFHRGLRTAAVQLWARPRVRHNSQSISLRVK